MDWRVLLTFGVVLASFVWNVRSEITLSSTEVSQQDNKVAEVKCTVSGEQFLGWFRISGNQQITNKNINPTVVTKGNQHTLRFQPVRVELGGKYACRAAKSGQKEVTIKVQFTVPLKNIRKNLDLGKTGKITIGAHGSPSPRFTWKKSGQTIDVSSSHYKLNRESGDLEIIDVVASDEGNYTCEISQFYENEETIKVEVFVVALPKILERPIPETRSLTEDYNVTFTCSASGLPPPQYEWKNPNGDKVSSFDPRFDIENGTLTITGIKKGDVGVWTCEAKNKRGSATATVNIKEVLVAPQISLYPVENPIIKAQGQRFKLICKVSGKPVPTIRWLKEGRIYPFKKDIPHKQIVDKTFHAYQEVYRDIKDNDDTNRSTITFREVDMWTDTGEYTCEAWNSARDGDDRQIFKTKTVQLLIRSKPILVEKASPGKVYSFLDNPHYVRIHCEYRGYPTPNITIWRGWRQLANGTGYADYWLKTDDRRDFGEFGCVGENEYGQQNHTIQLEFAKPPGKPRDVTWNATCDSIMLRWKEPLENGGMPIVQYFVTQDKKKTITVDVPKSTDPVYGRRVGNSYEVRGLERNEKYSFSVEARSRGARGETETILANTVKYCRPGRPTITAPTNSQLKETTIILAWDPPPDNGGDNNLRYRVQYKEVLGGTAKEETFPDSTETQFRLPGLKFGITYRFRVYAISKGGVGEPAEAQYIVMDVKAGKRSRAHTITAHICVVAALLFAALKL